MKRPRRRAGHGFPAKQLSALPQHTAGYDLAGCKPMLNRVTREAGGTKFRAFSILTPIMCELLLIATQFHRLQYGSPQEFSYNELASK
jgi:hypothetical protein